MAQNHVQKGEAMPFTNSSGSAIASGDVVKVGNRICVALGDIADGGSGNLATCEVWDLPKKAATAMAQGIDLYWDDTAKEITDVATANTLAGSAFAAAVDADATVSVKLNG